MITVIFDTNSYRQFVSEKTIVDLNNDIDKLLHLEKSKGYRAYVTNVVGMELMANVAEGEGGVNYQECINSLIFLSRHCYDEATELSRLIPPPFFHIANIVFGVLPINYNQQWLNISNLYSQFQLHNGLPENFFTDFNFYENLKNRAVKSEEEFSMHLVYLIDSARKNIKEENTKTSKKILRKNLIHYLRSDRFEQNLALGLLLDVAKNLDIKLETTQVVDMAEFLREKLPLTIGFFKWVTSKVVEDNIDMTSKKSKAKRWNWLWDYQLTFLISQHKIDGGEIILVTSDNELQDMLTDFGFKDKVMTLQQYQLLLKA